MKHLDLIAVGAIVYRWMLERGYMVDPDDGDVVADRVDASDAQDLVERLAADGYPLGLGDDHAA